MAKSRHALALVLPLLLVFYGAQHFGWLNDDALNYLRLAEHLSNGEGLTIRPSWGNHYWSVFPFGYPLLIAFTNIFVGDYLIASKLLNGLLLLGSIWLAARTMRLPIILAASVFYTAWILEIASYSWSENLFIFALMLMLFSLLNYLQQGGKWLLVGLGFGAILLFSSRYIGGFTLLAFMVSLWVYRNHYPRDRLLRAGLVIFSAILLFVAYLAYNKIATGHSTGLDRMAPHEELLWLLLQFFRMVFYSLGMLLPAIWLLAACKAKPANLPLSSHPISWAPILVGMGYLAILQVLRLTSHFEQPSGRLMTPGMLCIWLGVLHLIWHGWEHRPKIQHGWLILLVCALLNLGYVYREWVEQPYLALLSNRAVGNIKFERDFGHLPPGTVIVSAAYANPNVSWRYIYPHISSDDIFYVLIEGNPTPKQMRSWLSTLRYKGDPVPQYWFDFRDFRTIEEFKREAGKRGRGGELTNWMASHFKPSSLVPCSECSTAK